MSAAGANEASPADRLQLEVVAGNAAGNLIAIEERLVFGRQTEGPGQLAHDPELSRHHAEITRQANGEFKLEDLSSTNGTFLNGQRLQEPVVLSLGDTIELGSTELAVRVLPAVPVPPTSTVDVRAATVTVEVPAAVRSAASAPTPTPQPTPTPPPPPPEPVPFELHLKVDLARAEAEIALGESQSVRFALRDEGWQILDGDS